MSKCDINDLIREEGVDSIRAAVAERIASNGHDADAESPIEAEAKDIEAEVKRLSELSSLDYERIRQAEAQRLGMRVSALDRAIEERRKKADEQTKKNQFAEDIEPWPEPVDGPSFSMTFRA